MQMLIDKVLFLFVIIKNMRSKRTFLFLSVIFFVIFFSITNKTSAQRSGSLYFSVGYGTEWYSPSNIHIEQGDLNNSYEMQKVHGDDKTQTPISILNLNYRIGYYYNYYQTWGVELNFDPADYRIKDGESIHIKGTINNVPNVKETITFSAKNGYYYYFNGANLILFNVVRRFNIYHSNSNKIRLDALGKFGVGPVMPHFENSLPVNPVADPQLQFGGLNAGLEGAIRATVYRYGYIELAGKYDFATLNALSIYDGTARQNLQTFEVIASVGFTFPTTRRNPLFRNEKFVTILPFYQQAKLLKEGNDTSKVNDTSDHSKFNEIPEFQDIIDKEAQEAQDRYNRLHPPDTFTNADSIAHVDSVATMDSIAHVDSIARQDSVDRVTDSLNSIKPKKHKRHKHDQDTLSQDSTLLNNMQQANPDSAKQAMTDTVNKNQAAPPEKVAPPTPANKPEPEKTVDTTANSVIPQGEEKLSKKEEKKKAKEDKKEAKKKEKEAKEKAKQEEKEAKEKAKQAEEEAKKKAEEEDAAKKQAEQDKADKGKQDTPPPDNKGN